MGDKELKRELRLLDVFCIATGAMISSGLFILPGLAHAQAGPAVIISYFIAGLLAMTGMLSQAELVSAMPKAGGTYFYVARSMGPALGTIDGLLTWLSISLKSSFALVGMAAFAGLIVDVNARLVAALFCGFFVILNLVGIKGAGRLQVGLVVVLLALLGVYVTKGVPAVDYSNFSPFVPYGWATVFSTAGFVFVSYGGLLKVASVAEEVKDPGRTVPIGMILSLIVVLALYSLVVFVTSGVLGNTALDNSLTPLSDAAKMFMGRWGVIALSLAAILAFISTANAGIMSASRYPLALSRDSLLPPALSRINKKFGTPHVAIIFTGVIMLVALFLDLGALVKIASTVLIFTFIFSCLCVIVMRESGLQNYQPRFKAPFYPWIQVLGILGSWLLVINMGKEAILLVSLLFTAGFAVYWFYGRQRGKKDFALLHLIERIAARELVDVSLESELKEIIRERDAIKKDRFDGIIEECVTMDLEKEMPASEFFNIVSEKISDRTGVSQYSVMKLLMDREEEGTTVLATGLAIPHIIVEGENIFDIMLVRSKKGIIFPGAESKVHMVFVIAGSRDERPFHLLALSAIAQITEDKGFGERWMKAKDEEALKHIILLAQRKRTS